MKKSKQNNEVDQIQLLDNHLVSKSFFNSIMKMVQLGLTESKADKAYTCRMLCGEDIWEVLGSSYYRRLAGRCLAYMAVNKMLPLKFAAKRSPTKWYLVN